VQLPDRLHWLVGIDVRSETAFLLDGSPNALEGFNALMRKVQVAVRDVGRAEQLFFLYLEAVRGDGDLDALQRSALDLESLVFRYFTRHTSDPTARGRFEKWWGAVPASVKTGVPRPSAVKGQSGFDVHYYWFKNGVLSECFATVGLDGTVTEATPKRIAGKQ
jgi:hypothetical protein